MKNSSIKFKILLNYSFTFFKISSKSIGVESCDSTPLSVNVRIVKYRPGYNVFKFMTV